MLVSPSADPNGGPIFFDEFSNGQLPPTDSSCGPDTDKLKRVFSIQLRGFRFQRAQSFCDQQVPTQTRPLDMGVKRAVTKNLNSRSRLYNSRRAPSAAPRLGRVPTCSFLRGESFNPAIARADFGISSRAFCAGKEPARRFNSTSFIGTWTGSIAAASAEGGPSNSRTLLPTPLSAAHTMHQHQADNGVYALMGNRCPG